MKIYFVTSAYENIRSDRIAGYYSRPLNDFLPKLLKSNKQIGVNIFTDKYIPSFSEYNNQINVIRPTPEELVKVFWNEDDWKNIYKGLNRIPGLNDIFKKNGYNLLAVWLGKFSMIKTCFDQGAEVVLWFDAGHWTSHQHFADFSKYSRNMMNKLDCIGIDEKLYDASNKYGIISTQAWPALKDFHIPLEAYYSLGNEIGYKAPERLPLYQGVFLLINKKRFSDFFHGCQYWWLRLINNGFGGTEESAITLYGWENRVERISYPNWLSIFEGAKISEDLFDKFIWNMDEKK